MYHMANTLALIEYLLVLYFRPSLKSFSYVSTPGKSDELLKLSMLLMPVRPRHCYRVPWTIPTIRSHDQVRIQLFTYSSLPKKRGPPSSDGWCLCVSRSLPHFFVGLLTRQVDGLDIRLMLDSSIGP
jgi:hypothetical protein